jgi:uncharacterized protein YeaO (DUF488 family)
MHPIRLKRVYDSPSPEDGVRVLVERLWPRGLTREAASIDLWLKAVAPSAELRKWYGHDTDRWEEFQRRYRAELEGQPEAIDELLALARRGPVTLVFAKKDVERSSAMALKRYLEEVGGAGEGA